MVRHHFKGEELDSPSARSVVVDYLQGESSFRGGQSESAEDDRVIAAFELHSIVNLCLTGNAYMPNGRGGGGSRPHAQ